MRHCLLLAVVVLIARLSLVATFLTRDGPAQQLFTSLVSQPDVFNEPVNLSPPQNQPEKSSAETEFRRLEEERKKQLEFQRLEEERRRLEEINFVKTRVVATLQKFEQPSSDQSILLDAEEPTMKRSIKDDGSEILFDLSAESSSSEPADFESESQSTKEVKKRHIKENVNVLNFQKIIPAANIKAKEQIKKLDQNSEMSKRFNGLTSKTNPEEKNSNSSNNSRRTLVLQNAEQKSNLSSALNNKKNESQTPEDLRPSKRDNILKRADSTRNQEELLKSTITNELELSTASHPNPTVTTRKITPPTIEKLLRITAKKSKRTKHGMRPEAAAKSATEETQSATRPIPQPISKNSIKKENNTIMEKNEKENNLRVIEHLSGYATSKRNKSSDISETNKQSFHSIKAPIKDVGITVKSLEKDSSKKSDDAIEEEKNDSKINTTERMAPISVKVEEPENPNSFLSDKLLAIMEDDIKTLDKAAATARMLMALTDSPTQNAANTNAIDTEQASSSTTSLNGAVTTDNPNAEVTAESSSKADEEPISGQIEKKSKIEELSKLNVHESTTILSESMAEKNSNLVGHELYNKKTKRKYSNEGSVESDRTAQLEEDEDISDKLNLHSNIRLLRSEPKIREERKEQASNDLVIEAVHKSDPLQLNLGPELASSQTTAAETTSRNSKTKTDENRIAGKKSFALPKWDIDVDIETMDRGEPSTSIMTTEKPEPTSKPTPDNLVCSFGAIISVQDLGQATAPMTLAPNLDITNSTQPFEGIVTTSALTTKKPEDIEDELDAQNNAAKDQAAENNSTISKVNDSVDFGNYDWSNEKGAENPDTDYETIHVDSDKNYTRVIRNNGNERLSFVPYPLKDTLKSLMCYVCRAPDMRCNVCNGKPLCLAKNAECPTPLPK